MPKRIAALLVLLLAHGALAAEPASELSATQKELEAARQHYAALKGNAAALEKEMGGLQEKLVSLADKQKQREQKLVQLEARQAELMARVDEQQVQMQSQRKDVSRLITSLLKLSQVPPGAVVAMPGSIRQTLLAATLLQSTTQELQKRTAALSVSLAALQEDEFALERTHEQLVKERDAVVSNRKDLSSKIAERGVMQKKLGDEQSSEKSRIDKLAQQSASLQQLMKKLEEERIRSERAAKKAREKAQQEALKNARPVPRSLPSAPSAPLSTGTLPVAGSITTRYGQSVAGNRSQGLTIISRSNAQVVAPHGGEVIFTGPFMDYGRMVIIRHNGQYTSLLAGLSTIQCSLGQKILTGEPIGLLGTGNDGNSRLYMELRQNRQPVDPAPWLGKTLN